jgi:hypothetical protein
MAPGETSVTEPRAAGSAGARSARSGAAARSRPVVAGLLTAAIAAVILVANSHGHVDRMAFGDGLIYRYVAGHLSTPPDQVDPVVRERGSSLRYGRIGLPALIWAASAGRPKAIPFAQAAVMIVAAGAAGAAASLLFPGAGLFGGLIPFLALGFQLSIAGGFAEALAVACALWAVVVALRGRWWWCAGFVAAAMLTRENAGFVLLGLAVCAIVRRDRRALVPLACSLVPVAIWWGFVAARFGHIPPLDPYLRVTTDTVGTPGLAIVRSLIHAASVASASMAAAHLALGAFGSSLARRSWYGVLAAAVALQVLGSGPFAWRYVGDAARTGVFVQLFAVFAIVAWLRPAWVPEEALPARS